MPASKFATAMNVSIIVNYSLFAGFVVQIVLYGFTKCVRLLNTLLFSSTTLSITIISLAFWKHCAYRLKFDFLMMIRTCN